MIKIDRELISTYEMYMILQLMKIGSFVFVGSLILATVKNNFLTVQSMIQRATVLDVEENFNLQVVA